MSTRSRAARRRADRTAATVLAAVGLLLAACEPDLAETPTYEEVFLVRDVSAAGAIVLVANDLLGAPAPGGVDDGRLHDLLVLERSGDGLVRVGSLDLPAGPSALFARRVLADPSRALAYLGLGGAPGDEAIRIVDLSDPAAPVARGGIETAGIVSGLAVAGNVLFVSGPAGLQSYDVTDPDAPVPLGGWTPPDGASLAGLALAGQRLYAAGQAREDRGGAPFLFATLRVLDVSDPAAPVPIGRHDATGPFQSGGRSVQVDGDRAWLQSDIALEALEVADPARIRSLGIVPTDPTVSDSLLVDFAVVGDVALLATRRAGLRVVDVRDPLTPVQLAVLPGTQAPPLSQASALALAGGRAFLGLTTVGVRVLAVDGDEDAVLELVDVCPGVADPGQEDVDGDLFGDACDVCIEHPDPFQRDADGDGYGNRCDADFDNDGFVDFGDLAYLRAVFLGADPVADLDGSGVVDFADLALLRLGFFGPPGPSAFAPGPAGSGPPPPAVSAR